MANNRFVKSLPLSAVFNHVPILNKKHKHENQKFFDDSFIRVVRINYRLTNSILFANNRIKNLFLQNAKRLMTEIFQIET
jgi:hypothetical protein